MKKSEFVRPDINNIDYISNKCARDCYDKYFHTFKLRCIFSIEMINGFVGGKI